jgi:hypothetical protein
VQKEVRTERKKFSLSTMPAEIKCVLHAGLPCYPFSLQQVLNLAFAPFMDLNETFVEIMLKFTNLSVSNM